jgi:DNA-3-methyladenine glycosylase I
VAVFLMNKKRCAWCKNDSLYIAYHDTEWGVPIYDDKLLFEFLILEGMQAGLSWLTILKKRAAFRVAFAHFDAEKIAKFDQQQIDTLLNNSDIIRNKLKISSAVQNANAFLQLTKDSGSFANYIWSFVKGHPLQHNWRNINQVPAKTAISDVMSKDLKERI